MKLPLIFSVLVAGAAIAGDAAAPKREPGKWKTEVTIVGIEMAGRDSKMKELALDQALPARTECLSKKSAAEEEPISVLSKGAGDCTFTKKNISSTVDVSGTCKGPDGMAITMTMTGTFDSKKIDLDVESSGPSPMGAGSLTSKIKITGTLIGTC